jgi:hypothetical protein
MYRSLLPLSPAATVVLFLTSWCVAVQQGDDRGPAWKRHVIDDASRGADGARLLDINGDGLPDVTTGWEEGGQVRVCVHPGRAKVRQKWPSVLVGQVKSPEDAVFVDLNGDGAADVVSCCEGKTNQVFAHWSPKDRSQLLNERAWKTESFPAVAGMCQWMFAEPVQIDGKHGVDLVVGGKNKNGQIGWLEAPANPRELSAWKYHKLRDAGWIMSLVAADMDGDGDADVLVSDRRGKQRGCFWLENPGAGAAQRMPWKEHAVGSQGEEVMFLVLADLDGDGLRDVIVTTHNRKLQFHRQVKRGGKEWKTHSIRFPERTGSGKAVRVADVDGDGKLDLVVACADAKKGSGIVWLSYRTSVFDAEWDVHELSGPGGIKFDLIQLVDLDGDGDLDVINTDEQEAGRGLGVVWYENPTK